MNPNASTFRPATKCRPAENRGFQMTYLINTIVATKEEQNLENHKLHALHQRMQQNYHILLAQTERTNRREAGCLPQRQISQMMVDYQTHLADYKKQNVKVNDITATLMTLEQRLQKLKLAVVSASLSSASPVGIPDRKSSWIPFSSFDFSGKISMTKLDGIEMRNKHEKHANTLPPIDETCNESEADSLDDCNWSDFEDEFADDDSLRSATGSASKVPNTESYNEPEETPTISTADSAHTADTADTADLALTADPDTEDIAEITAVHPVSPVQFPRTMPSPLSPCAYSNAPTPPSELSMSPDLVSDEADLEQLRKEMAGILDTAMYRHIAAISPDLEKVLEAQGGSVEAVCALVDCLVDYAVNSKPRLPTLCARKYAEMCWTMQNYCHSVSRGETAWVWSAECFAAIQKLDFYELLWQRLRATFGSLQVGQDPLKFVNVMILIAELYNARLLYSSQMVEVMDAILCQRNVGRIGENDVDGLYEIFKRSAKGLQRCDLTRDIEYYLEVLHKVKGWKKFKATRYPSVSFMIGQMHNWFYGN